MKKPTCTICGRKVLARGWCSTHYSQWKRSGSPLAPRIFKCQTCGQSEQRKSLDGPVPRFCSPACHPRRIAIASRQKAREAKRGTCQLCGTATEGFGSYKIYCSSRCQTEHRRFPDGRVERDCHICGQPINFELLRPSGRRLGKNTRKCFTCRRDQRYSMTAEALALRDGHMCSLCGHRVDMTLPWPDRWSPSVDHILPASRGGSNAPDNLQLAHLTCNISKRNRVPAS